MFKKPKKNPKAKFRSRKRTTDSNPTVDGNGDDEGQSKSNFNSSSSIGMKPKKRFRPRRSRDSDDSDSDDNGKGSGSGNSLLEQYKDEQKKGKKLKSGMGNGSNSKQNNIMHQYKSNDGGPSQKDLATRTAEHHPEERERGGANGNGDHDTADAADDGTSKNLYKGKKETRNKFLAGPIRAPTFVRTTSRFDYQPDVCKDYKDTGFCGFGDSCIYLHTRENTLTGWQLDQEYERKKKAAQDKKELEMDAFCRVADKPMRDEDGVSGQAAIADDGLPFGCHLCREPFTDPVVTTCNHYFCQQCIMDYVKSENTTACPICSKDTHGVFNHPIKLITKKRRSVGSSATWAEFAEKFR